MHLAVIGLGRMGASMMPRLMAKGRECKILSSMRRVFSRHVEKKTGGPA